jgi:restriction system protein
MTEKQYKITIPIMPLYSQVNTVLKIWDNTSKAAIHSTIKSIKSQIGTFENPVDWSDPDQWIPARLSGDEAQIALNLWEECQKSFNPRYMYRLYRFVDTHALLLTDDNGVYRISKRGASFLSKDHRVIQEIDNKEGILDLLNILTVKKSGKIRDLLPDWDEFLREFFRFGEAKSSQEMLRSRLYNLIERCYVNKEKGNYFITPKGFEYITNIFSKHTVKSEDSKRELHLSIEEYNVRQRKILKEKLSKIDPYQFEHLVKNLLEQMGYENVIVTKQSGDQGIDVVGEIQSGISIVKEVIQVKRHKSNITRPVIDQLRGALVYQRAIRGTVITTGNFSKGCDEAANYLGAAPITLMDGDNLVDNLIKYQIGIMRKPLDIYDVDENYFNTVKDEAIDFSGAN